jgi:hypothetical protein
VRRIFAMTMEGHGPYQIAQQLTADKVEIPAVHLARNGEGVNKNKTFKDIYGWGSSTIVNILKKREYLGHTVNFKTHKHFKDKKSHYVDESQWTIFENTHEAIIDQATFDNVQRIRSNVRRYPDGWGEAHPLTGPDVLRRLRRQNVRPSHQQRQTHPTVYLLPIQQSPCRDALPHPAPH